MAENSITLTFHGAAETVTGSCMEYAWGGRRILVDCGLFQGSRTLESLNYREFDFDAKSIDAVVLTHAHIDHSGLLPKLVANGFSGPIWCTAPTRDLLEFMLADAGRIQEMDAERRNRRRDRAGEPPFVPLYTEQDANAAWRKCRAVDLGEWFEPAAGFRARLWNAGHVLGSASVELEAAGARVMCSGDVGPEFKAFLEDPAGPAGFDHIVCEGTYGGRRRERLTIEQRRAVLQTEVVEALGQGGNLVIPAFALERTQELLLDLAALRSANRIPSVPVFVDSPLASEITGVFASYAAQLSDTGGSNVFADPGFHFVGSVAESIRLNSVSGAIILAASGMCEGGRIRHHLLHNLHRRDSTVLFVGFQAQGTLGRVLLEGAKVARISGSDIQVRARIREIDTYSAHADQGELLDWIAERRPVAGTVFLDHGELRELEALRGEVQRADPATKTRIPKIGEVYSLPQGQEARRLSTGRLDAQAAVGRDWQNAYADLVGGLKSELKRVPDEKREEAIRRMREVLKSYTAFRDGRREQGASAS
ncbi:MBL fold metallo-hydrolase [Novosphingobium tardum]|uniref:MBL fold metallo-hydrolase n=1 Tax=Novosphingobium tardum TaxID=1538021 RepID=A0ABV8RSN7_9SPHN